MSTSIQKNIVSQTANRFRNLSIKRTAWTVTLLVAGMLFSGNAFGAIYRTSAVVSGGQNRTATYGTAAVGGTSITYTITITATRFSTTGNTLSNTLTFAWTGLAPTGVIATLSNGGVYTPGQNPQTVTLTITTSANTDANTPAGYAFTVTSNERNGGIQHSDNDALVIGKKNLTITGVSASDKNYDGTTTAAVSGGTLNGRVTGDVVSVNPVGTFSSSAVGTNKNVTISLTGADAGNYTFTQPTVRADINALALTVSNLIANNKVYDGTTSATFAAGYTLNGVLAVDAGNVIINPAGLFQNNGPGNGIKVTVSLNGSATGNYTLTQPAGLTANIVAATYDWTGTQNTTWTNPQNWNVAGVGVPTTYPGQSNNDDARIGVTGTITNQPAIASNLPHSLNSLTFGSSASATILTINTGVTFNPGDFTINANSTANIMDNGAVNLAGNYSTSASSILNLSGSSTFTYNNVLASFTNTGTINQSGTGNVSINASPVTNQGTINQSGTGSMTLSGNSIFGFALSSSGTINQSGTGSITFNTFALLLGSNVITNSNTISQTGAGTITFNEPFNNSATASNFSATGAGTLAFGSTFTNSGTTTFGPATVTIADDFTNTSGTTTFGSGPATLSGEFTNTAGSVTFGTGLVTFNAPGSSIKITNPQNSTLTFVNVLFTKGHFLFKTNGGSSSLIAIASTGVMTLSSNAQLDFANVKQLLLLSDANSSATIAAIPPGCTINADGKAAVQRFIKGSSTDLSKRGYRALTSTVYTGSAGGINFYDLDYMKNSVHNSGPGYAANGFDVTSTTNPSLYLFREDIPPPPSASTLFTTGYNWKGIAKINDSPLYKIGTQAKNTTANIFETSYNLPVGNGIFFFFRGDKNQPVTPISPPNDVVLTQVGTLNTGTIKTNLWYAADNALPANTFSYTDPSTDPAYNNPELTLKAGFALMGNPYPSTINWEKYNKSGAAGALTGSVSIIIYMFNPQTHQFDAYRANPDNNTDFTSEFTNTSDGSVGGTATGAASNFIASGQGFFVVATAPEQTLTFNETAKVSAQPTAANLNKLMGKPVGMVAAAPKPLLRLKLSSDSVNTDDIAIRLDNNSSAKFVRGEDATDIGGNGNLVSLSSFSADSIGVPLAINYMPFPGVKPSIVGLAVDAASSGTYQLTMPKLANLPALYNVWLKDAFTADSLKLTEGASYTFTIDKANAATFVNKRFTLVIGQDPAKAYKLLDFTATKTDHKTGVELVWKTANEGNSTNFTVERSAGKRKPFEVIGGMRSTDAGTYSLLDKRPDNGKNFYRLKQVDINDSVTYSDVVEVKYADKRDQYAHNLHIYPNPASHSINLSINDDHDRGRVSYNINFVNCFGMIVKQVNSSQADWQGNISNLRPGTYLVKVVNNRTQNLVGENKFVKL